MGHNTLGVIPRSIKWARVTSLLEQDADVSDIVAASAAAAERQLLSASDDPAYVEAVRLLLMIPAAARAEDFREELRQLGLDVADAPSVLDLVVAATMRLEEIKRSSNRRTDLGELAGRALTTALGETIGEGLPGLFEPTSAEVQNTVRKLSQSKGIAVLVRSFMTNVVQATISYYLERELANRAVSPSETSGIRDRGAFDLELSAYTHEATRIIQEFSGGWYGKTLWESGQVSTADAARFGAVCLKKIVEELRVKRAEHV